MKRIFKGLLSLGIVIMSFCNVTNIYATENVTCNSFVYGKSEMGRDLVCYSIYGENYDKTILLNFAIHGFEDEYDHDSYVLTETANELIEYYKNAADMHNCRLLIIPCANPDGQIDGITNYGFGRCNAKGIDLNRDFDVNYQPYSSARNYTQTAFSAAESRALRDLCNEYKPYVVIDFHGWENCTIGDYEIASVFYDKMGLMLSHPFTSTNATGYFSNWAHQNGSYGLLVEFTNSSSIDITKLESATDRLVSGDFDNGEGYYKEDSRYSKFNNIKSYTISTGRTTTYADIDVPYKSTSYIDGYTDLCVIQKIYDNGWVKVEYPISSGTKIGFVHLSDFISNPVTPYKVSINSSTTVYRREDLSENLGTAYTTDDIYALGRSIDGQKTQIIYELDNGGYKLGWVNSSILIQATKLPGDVNNDNLVDFSDAIIILQADSGLVVLDNEQKLTADINKDGDVDYSDAIRVLQMDAEF